MSQDTTPTFSYIDADGILVELLYDAANARTTFVVGRPGGSIEMVEHFDTSSGERLTPYSATNNLLTTGCVLLPSGVGDFGDKGDLLRQIGEYLDRYVDLSPVFRELAPYYVLLTWVYDAFNELPYLRFRGDWGGGKTRMLITVGSICYKPFFASGASTVSPIFHILDTCRGTLALDESDFRYSDKTAELTKVLNNGNVAGLPVLRTMTNRHRELNPQAFRVFGPKLVAMRERFEDQALESRFLTEETSRRTLPPHIPIHLPTSLKVEAQVLRNRLLAWRLRERHLIAPDPTRLLQGANGRTNQTALALLSLVDDAEARERIGQFIMANAEAQLAGERETPERRVLSAVLRGKRLSTTPFIPISEITSLFNQRNSETDHLPMSNKWIGSILRTRLQIATAKSHGVYVVPQSEWARLDLLAERYGLSTDATEASDPQSA